MAKGTLVVIEPNGTLSHVRVENPKGWTIEQLYHLIGCEVVQPLRVVYDERRRMAYADENARLSIVGRPKPPVNPKATQMFRAYYGPDATEILGVAVVWVPDEVEGVGRRGVLSTKRKRAERAKEQPDSLPSHEREDVEQARDSLQEDTPKRFGGYTPAAPLSDDQ